MSFERFESKTPVQAQALRAATSFVESFDPDAQEGQTLWLWSVGYGVGKTHLARSIQRAIVERGYRAVFRLWPEVLEAMKDTFDLPGKTTEDVLRPLHQADLLILDDVGKEHSPRDADGYSWAQSQAFRVIGFFYRTGRSVVITTNCPPERLVDWVGPAAVSRLWEMLTMDPVDMTGEDYRMRPGSR